MINEGRSKGEFSIPLRKISFSANVSGMFAQVTCQQEFENKSDVSVEAVYVFPLPEEASVVGCEMTIGDKKITAELKEREQARKEYEDAVAAGHHASLLEQKRENIFRINVGGIEPGENIKSATTYNQRVPWQNNGGRFSIPLVVAPRFIPGIPTGTKTGGGWAEDTDVVPDASEITPVVAREGVPYTADIRVVISPGFTCNISSPSHDLTVGEHRFVKDPVEIEATGLTPDRDFILCYQTESARVESAIHKGSFDGDHYVTIDVIPPGNVVTRPKDVIFCLDISGSMTGPKLEGLKVVAEKVARKLSEQDKENRIAVVAFESQIHPIQPLSEINDATFEAIQELGSMGGTHAGKALDYCFQQLSGESSKEKYILLVSDGQTADKWSKVVRGVRVIAVGIDVAVNMSYLRDIAHETGGVNIAIYPGEDYDTVAGTIAGLLSGPVLSDIKVSSGDKALEDTLGSTDVYLSMPASLNLKTTELPGEVQLRGVDSREKQVLVSLELRDAPECAFAHQIWAREKLRDRELSESDLVAISVKYGIISSQTAFVAVHLKEVPGAKPERVEVPVSLPHTWDYDSVFGELADVGLALASPFSQQASLEMPTFLRSRRAHYVAKRQTVPSVHASDELEGLVNELEHGSIDRSAAEALWKSLARKITGKAVKSWTAVQKAKAYYYLLRLRTFGFKVRKAALKLVSAEPDRSDTEAHNWWQKAQRVLGVMH